MQGEPGDGLGSVSVETRVTKQGLRGNDPLPRGRRGAPGAFACCRPLRPQLFFCVSPQAASISGIKGEKVTDGASV